MKSLAVGEMQFEACVAIRSKENQRVCVSVGRINQQGIRETIDMLPKMVYRTIIITARNHKRAKAMASHVGLVQWCRKLDPYYELYKIEHLNLHQDIQLTTEPAYEMGDNFEINKVLDTD